MPSPAEKPMAKIPPKPVLVLFGLDHANRPHASAFASAEAAAARGAAKTMQMACLELNTTEQRRLASDLPAGKLFKSGNAFVPFVSQKVFDQIVQLAPEDVAKAAKRKKLRVIAGTDGEAKTPSHGKTTAPVTPHFPTDWSKIKLGSHVLANEMSEDGWYECVVVEYQSDILITLLWTGYPDLPKFFRRRNELGLMPVPPGAETR
jgi:hypothetical protein